MIIKLMIMELELFYILCEPVFADINNYEELLIDSGYYTAKI